MSSRLNTSLSVTAPNASLADLTLQGLNHRDTWLQAKNALLGQDIDLSRIERVEVQRILRALGIAPKPREWFFDKQLNKAMQNQLMNQAALLDGIQEFFLEIVMNFWHKLELQNHALLKAVLRRESRTVHALLARNDQIEKLLKNFQDNELKNYVEYQKAVLADLKQQQAELETLMHMMVGAAAHQFIDFAHEDKVLNQVFDGVEEEGLQKFAQIYIEKRLKHDARADKLVDQFEKKMGLRLAPEPDSKADDQADRFDALHQKLDRALDNMRKEQAAITRLRKLQAIKQQLEHERAYYRALPHKVAVKCNFDQGVCLRVEQNQTYINATMTQFCAPRIQPMMAVREELQRNLTCQAQIIEQLKPVEQRLAHSPFQKFQSLRPSFQANEEEHKRNLKMAG